ncbi:MAG: hypothetical protein AAF627_22205 [Myxococcota bacterium]
MTTASEDPASFIQDPQTKNIVFNAEDYAGISAGQSTAWLEVDDSALMAGSGMEASPDNGTQFLFGDGPRLDYPVVFSETGEYRVWVRGRAQPGILVQNDSIFVGLDGLSNSFQSSRFDGFRGSLSWSIQLFRVQETGLHMLNLFVREDGFLVDAVMITKLGDPNLQVPPSHFGEDGLPVLSAVGAP